MKSVQKPNVIRLFGLKTAVVVLMFVLFSTSRRGISQEVYSSSSSFASYAIDANGNLYTWGEDEYHHPVTTSMMSQDLTPVEVAFPAGVTSWVSIAAGHVHTLAIGNDGDIYAWGDNDYGQLGDGSVVSSDTLVKVDLPSGVTAKQVSCGYWHSLALCSDGTVYAWGENNNGQLGNGTTTNSDVPVKVDLPSGVTPVAVLAGWYYSFALGADGTLYAWGGNVQGQLGLGNTTSESLPVKVPFPSGVTKWTGMYGGIYFAAAMGNDGNLYESGYNQYGQLGNGTATGTSSGVMEFQKANMPAGVTGWNQIACTGSSVLAIGNNDTLYAWGYGGSGEMGNGTTLGANPVAVRVSMPPGVVVTSLAAGRNHALAIGSDGNIYAWGQGGQGQLGNNSIRNSSVPVQLLLNYASSTSGVRLVSVIPGWTDPSIETVHGPSIAVYNPAIDTLHKLILFLVGTGGSATPTWTMDSIYASMGYYAITLDYEDNVVAASLGNDSDTTAFGDYRDEIVTGTQVSNAVNVDSANSILNRFQKLLVYLAQSDTAGNWTQFLQNGEPIWNRIVVAGHSQGSGHAAYIAKMFDVSRVLMFSGPQDFMTFFNRPAPWLYEKGATPPTSYFAFLNQYDPYNVNHQVSNCSALMDTQRPAILTNVTAGRTITGNWRILVTDTLSGSAHGSTILPIFANVWYFMLSAQLPIVPSTPVSISPVGGTRVPRRTPLKWTSASPMTGYVLQVATDPAFASMVVDTSVADTSITLSVTLAPGTKYYWHVVASDMGFVGSYSAVDSFTTGTGIDAIDEQKSIPAKFAVSNNYPNPFNPSTTIRVSLARAGVMSLRIFNALGQLVEVVADGFQNAGSYTYNVDMERFSSGVYFYSLREGADAITRKMLFLK